MGAGAKLVVSVIVLGGLGRNVLRQQAMKHPAWLVSLGLLLPLGALGAQNAAQWQVYFGTGGPGAKGIYRATLDTANGKLSGEVPCESYAATGQGWRLDPAGLVISRIDAGEHGKCLDAGTGAAGAQVLLWDCHGQPNQRWRVSGTQLINDAAGQCLTAATAPGGALRLGTCDGSTSQRWVPTLQ